ncbi:MAG: hypothetical protein FRX48_07388 [Lasallia pustulata]|uniref:Uncharacterized protein n=1 Tax=Lasallia pustulata TaxID=136370 RepID=A0A5M8PJV3_9LECA|nr:MAG: hypothetical protein FRX48_07388 [Lasallia pustulata]
MKAVTILIAVFVAILNSAAVLSAPINNANSLAGSPIVKPDNPSADPFFGDNVPASAKIVEKSDEFSDCAAPCDFYVHRSIDTNAMADVYATPGAIDGQVPGVVPVGKRDAVLVEKSDTIEDCAAPCDFYIRSVATEDMPSSSYKEPGSGLPILPRKVAPVGYHIFVDDEAPKYKRDTEDTPAEAAAFPWPPGFKGPKSKRDIESSPAEFTNFPWPPGFKGPRSTKRDIEGAPAETTSFPWPSGFKGPRSKRDEGNADCEHLDPLSLTTVIVNACDTSKRFEAKVPLDPASGGYAPGAPKGSEQVTR